MASKYKVKIVFVASGDKTKFTDVYETVISDKYLKEQLITCKTWHEYDSGVINSRCELLFDELFESAYRQLWRMLGKNVTSYVSIRETNLMLSMF